MTTARRLLLPAAALAAVSCLGACAGGGDDNGASTSTSTTTQAPTSTTSSPATSTTTPSSTTSSSNATTSAAPTVTKSVGSSACTSGDVTVTVKPAGGAAGHVLYDVVATARPGHVCTLRGYPGVSLVAAKGGKPIGHPATRVKGPTTTVVLTPGKTATAAVQLAQAGNYDGCTKKQAAGFAVYLPDQKYTVFVPASATGCTQTSITLLEVKPFAS